jgi:hypothetical protein
MELWVMGYERRNMRQSERTLAISLATWLFGVRIRPEVQKPLTSQTITVAWYRAVC